MKQRVAVVETTKKENMRRIVRNLRERSEI